MWCLLPFFFSPKTGHLGGHSSCNVLRFHISIFSVNNNHTQSGLKELTFHPCGSDLKDSNFSYELSTELDVFNWPFSLQNKQVRVSLMCLLLYWIGACEVQSPWTLKHSIRLQCNTVELFHDDLRPWSGWRDCSGPRLGCQQGKTSGSHGLWAAKSLLFVFLLENWWRINKISPL